MAKQKPESTNHTSNFFTFEKIGDNLKGKFLGLFETKYGIAIGLKLGDKTKFCNTTTVMQDILDNNMLLLKKDVELDITMTDELPGKGRKSGAKLFEIKLNGKILESAFQYKEIELKDFSFSKIKEMAEKAKKSR